MSQEDMESKVYSALPVEDDHKLVEITAKMQQEASKVMIFAQDPKVSISHAVSLAQAVEEFLKVSGWSRS